MPRVLWMVVAGVLALGCRRPLDPGAWDHRPACEIVDSPPTLAVVRHHHDRNALVGTALTKNYLMAVAESGAVVAFDRSRLSPGRHQDFYRRVVAVGPGEDDGDVLVGFSSGRIARLESANFAVTTVADVPGRPVFIGREPIHRRAVVVFGRPIATPHGWGDRGLHQYQVRALDGAWQTKVDAPTTFFIDSRGRLWLGSDHGEWGGGIAVVDLASGRLMDIPWKSGTGVYGFLERPDGRIWAFGGLAHLGSTQSIVEEVQPGKPARTLYQLDTHLGPKGNDRLEALIGRQPAGPISGLIAVGRDRLLALSLERVYETDTKLGTWKQLAQLALDGPSGRPDATSSYSAVRSWSLVDGRLLLVTARDGLLELDPDTGKTRSHAVAGDLRVQPRSILPTPLGPIVTGEAAPQRWDGRAWAPVKVPFAGPFERHPGEAWTTPAFLPIAEHDAIMAVTWEDQSDGSADPREPALLVAGIEEPHRDRTLLRQVTSIDPSMMFTLGSEVWAYKDGFWEVHDGRWRQRGPAAPIGGVVRAVAPHAGGWWLLVTGARDKLALARLEVPAGAPVRLALRDLSRNGVPLPVSDVLLLDGDRLLIAAGAMLSTYRISSGELTPLALTGLTGEVHRLARDGEGRIWMAGRGLWMLQDLSRVVSFDALLPFVHDCDTFDLVARGQELFVALGARGMAVLHGPTLIELAPRQPPLPAEELPRPHEARFGDQAVFLDLHNPVTWSNKNHYPWEQRFEQAIQRAIEAVTAAGSRAILAEDGFDYRDATLYTNDATAVLALIEKSLRASGVWEHTQVRKRLGPPGTPEVLVKATHPEPP